ncbi:conserved hypothetical protein [Chlorobaculum parvum NCIB 8327]|uniref:Uncharacterized protein n=1 Tax=Chlorobaculum parvum (strain DSM 263 / NCIMB 8327) TaxID=517417 RepID=B3QME8_CHLP8|nr:hypothetical protein [Chlorobaculum parvum]ACF11101.1 conserved hypothetical protein [Chlorobaculum parvum NCIB 8327]
MAGSAFETWEKVLEYASVPLHGTMSRKIRKGVKLQINEGTVYENAVLFISDLFLRVTEDSAKTSVNTYYNIDSIASIRTYSTKEA